MEFNNMSKKSIDFPFSAVQGQPLFKLALLLATVNPLLGGVLIVGPRGCAKSTLARGLSDLLPTSKGDNAEFVTLPLGATEEMLIGTLDIENLLADKKMLFSAGLLKKADGGVLYVDEVNLLPDHLVDQLLDVASSGVNVIERDGISHQHDAKFTLIGTMNPDEGELRPQLQDRFGLMVELDNQYTMEERVNIVKIRQHFEANKKAFFESYQDQQNILQTQIHDARELLSQVNCDDDCFIDIAMRCQNANVEGLRADIMMHRASITYAAWCGRQVVTLDDIAHVAPLVLRHRQQDKNDNTSQSNPPPPPTSGGFSRPPSPENKPSDDNKTENKGAGEWGSMKDQQGEVQKISHLQGLSCEEHARLSQQLSTKQGSAKRAENKSKIDWLPTFTRELGEWPPTKLTFKKIGRDAQKIHLILLDTSASTLSEELSGIAKGVISTIAQKAYLQRDKLSVIGFGNDQVTTIIEVGRSPKNIENILENIPALGGTPLRLGLKKMAERIKQLLHSNPDFSLLCYLITDGRSRADVHDLKLNQPTLLIDIEKSTIKRGRGRALSDALDANYLSLCV